MTKLNTLTLLMKKREMNLAKVAWREIRSRERLSTPRELVEILHDNSVTDAQMQYYFTTGALPNDVLELHLKRCENSGVVECTCLTDRGYDTYEEDLL